MKLFILTFLVLCSFASASEKPLLVRPNCFYFSDDLVNGIKHFENDKLYTGKIKLDRKRVDKLAGSYTEEIAYGFTSNLIKEAVKYGYLEKGYRLPATMTRQQAHNFLVKIALPTFNSIIMEALKVEISNAEREALVMFAYNNGSAAARKLIKTKGRMNCGNKAETIRILNLYVNAGKHKKVKGLIRRRQYETKLFYRTKTILLAYKV